MFFTGNPGTGKTTVARIITGILYNMGYIKENKCVEVGKQDIVGQYLGQSAQKADAVIKSALGGVLFIDEAYSLCEKYQNDGFAKETVEIILKAMEDHKDDLIIIFAGYTKEMKQFKEMNPGLKSRIGLTIEFPDYTPDELTEIFVKKAEDCGYTVPEESERKIHYLCSMASMEKDFGNGRFVDNLFREVEINHALTTKDINAYDKRIMTILPEDVTDDILDKVL
jgi:Holliday junction resolvasome RuvABC ATP-dependent DNA helicase subunit